MALRAYPRPGVGVLAPADAFGPAPAEIGSFGTTDDEADLAAALLAAGYPASALRLLKDSEFIEYDDTMRAAYLALGRTMQVDRVDAWLRFHDV